MNVKYVFNDTLKLIQDCRDTYGELELESKSNREIIAQIIASLGDEGRVWRGEWKINKPMDLYIDYFISC